MSEENDNKIEKQTGTRDEFEHDISNFKSLFGEENINRVVNSMILDFASGYTKDESVRWFNIQKPLLPSIKGLDVTKHKLGACLYGEFGRYTLEIGIEDATQLEDIEFYDVMVVDKLAGLDNKIVFHSALLFSVEDIVILVELLELSKTTSRDNNPYLKDIIQLLYSNYYDPDSRSQKDVCYCVINKFFNIAKNGIYTAYIDIFDYINDCECNSDH